MPPITLEQALFQRPDRQEPKLLAHSAGFDDAWIASAHRLVVGFGDRRGGGRCPLTVFARPISAKHIAVVRVKDENAEFPTGLRFHFLVVERKAYEAWIRDPFMLAEKIEPTWEASDPLPALMIAEEAFSPRTLSQVQGVLRPKKIRTCELTSGRIQH